MSVVDRAGGVELLAGDSPFDRPFPTDDGGDMDAPAGDLALDGWGSHERFEVAWYPEVGIRREPWPSGAHVPRARPKVHLDLATRRIKRLRVVVRVRHDARAHR